MSKKLRWLCIGWIGIILAILPACAPKRQTLKGDARDAVLAYADPMADRLLQALNEDDYDTFAQDLSEPMKKSLTSAAFAQTRKQVIGKVGQYVSRQVQNVFQTGQAGDDKAYVTVVYVARFEQDQAVTITISFDLAEPHQINGLWFNSERLRQ